MTNSTFEIPELAKTCKENVAICMQLNFAISVDIDLCVRQHVRV